MKKTLTVLMAAATAVAGVMGLTACGKGSGSCFESKAWKDTIRL